MTSEEHVGISTTKIERYGWKVSDEPGVLQEIDKNDLFIETEYQRKPLKDKIIKIAADWSWVACGVIIVGLRNGKYWIIDGNHRVLAAKKRADIIKLPCIVFVIESIREEARGFVGANTNRKPITGLQKFKAEVIAENITATYVNNLMSQFNIKIERAKGTERTIASISCLLKYARKDRPAFEAVIRIIDKLFGEAKIDKALIEGLFYIHDNCEKDLNDELMQKRLIKVGVKKLNSSIFKATLFFESRSGKACGHGIFIAINRNIQNKFIMKN